MDVSELLSRERGESWSRNEAGFEFAFSAER